MKQFGQDYFICSSKVNQELPVNKISKFMDKIQLTKEITKLRNLKNSIVPHYKKLMDIAQNKVFNKSENLSDKRIYKSV